ncbi:MAG: class I poly(R)-hydroxyalkanoic acid synthase [Burkholderiales bacterium]|nr:class I poly(R)-hydroxyalkanoic acid synthase [Burkholderiales bacterium]
MSAAARCGPDGERPAGQAQHRPAADKAVLAQFEEHARRLLGAATAPLGIDGGPGVNEIMRSLTAGLAEDVEKWRSVQERHYARQLALWRRLAGAAAGDSPSGAPAPDRRFAAPEWREHAYFDCLAQSYLDAGVALGELARLARLEPHARRKLEFMVRQFVDAMSPANYPWSNPEAIKLAAQTGGESLARGLRRLAADAAKGMLSMTDETAFAVGENLAITPGAVVFENELMQLLQYRAASTTVFERPLVMVPPCINKFYILDLQPENSFVRYAVAEGRTVFMLSWRNVTPELGTLTWDDYVERGVIRAIEAAAVICGTDEVDTLGFCVGGTLLGSAAAVLAGRGEKRISTVTLITSMLDFSDTGELGVFVDEAFVRRRERDFAAGGVLPGRELAVTFASLRANELLWRCVVENYLKGKDPEPFDLLYWNADGTNLPGAMYAYYLRNMYLENNLRVPGRLTMCGVPVDLGRLDQPAYVLAAREDHIVPWRTAYASMRLLAGRIEFVLAASGHIAGVINPAGKNRRSYRVGPVAGDDPEEWLVAAQSRPGSWWGHWSGWLAAHSRGTMRAPRAIAATGQYREIEPAPGRYVRVRSD